MPSRTRWCPVFWTFSSPTWSICWPQCRPGGRPRRQGCLNIFGSATSQTATAWHWTLCSFLARGKHARGNGRQSASIGCDGKPDGRFGRNGRIGRNGRLERTIVIFFDLYWLLAPLFAAHLAFWWHARSLGLLGRTTPSINVRRTRVSYDRQWYNQCLVHNVYKKY